MWTVVLVALALALIVVPFLIPQRNQGAGLTWGTIFLAMVTYTLIAPSRRTHRTIDSIGKAMAESIDRTLAGPVELCQRGHGWCGRPAGHTGWCNAERA